MNTLHWIVVVVIVYWVWSKCGKSNTEGMSGVPKCIQCGACLGGIPDFQEVAEKCFERASQSNEDGDKYVAKCLVNNAYTKKNCGACSMNAATDFLNGTGACKGM